MRIWSLHPKYLDSAGLVALWREALLAKHVLEGKSKGYSNHPQLQRFRKTSNPQQIINQYLSQVFFEAEKRGFHFQKNKINWEFENSFITVTTGQLMYETKHLLRKLKLRNHKKYERLKSEPEIDIHPVFKLINGGIEKWEVLPPGEKST